MKTQLNASLLALTEQQHANEILRACVHCGFCLPTCPTYDLLGNELDSPRGRIYLIKQALEGHFVSQETTLHLDRCLSCRACETACPSGVRYTQLLDLGRRFISQKTPRSLWQQIRRDSVRKILTTPRLINTLVTIFPWLTQKISPHFKAKPSSTIPTLVQKKILLLSGCVQPALAPNINQSIQHSLTQLGYQVIETPQTQCCGALDQHLDAHEAALIKIKYNIDQCYQHLQQGVSAIISSASGCSVMIKDYPYLVKADPIYLKKANAMVAKTYDIAEFLSTENLNVLVKKNHQNRPQKLSFHSPCTMQHGLQITGVIEKILVNLGYQLNSMKDSHLCCGSAGTYSIFQPKLSQQLRENKLNQLTHNQPDMIVTANVGCLIHLQKGSAIQVKHWVELLN
jgi:glycolate oxidase iron-sulfur subunit